MSRAAIFEMTRRQAMLAAYAPVFMSCQGVKPVHAEEPLYTAFKRPEEVVIDGYSGDAMEPFLTRDGRMLLFNNRNDPGVNTNVHWARRVDDLRFAYIGEVPGVNSAALDGVPSVSKDSELYFVSLRSYDKSSSTIYRAQLGEGGSGVPELVEGISKRKPGWVNFDAEISADGSTLYFVDSYFGLAGAPQDAALVSAARQGNGFRRLNDHFGEVNQQGSLQYAPSTSLDQLECFFTRYTKNTPPAIFRSTRKSVDQPFTKPMRVQAIEGFAEATTFSPDERSLYYHARAGNGSYRIRRVRR